MATPYLQYGNDGLSGFDANGVRRIWLDPLNLLFSFFDANGIPRCEIGNLPARGMVVGTVGVPTSPAHWGFRVNDSSGNPIYDSQGVIQHTTPLGGSPIFDTTAHGFSNNPWAQVPSSPTVTFTLTRPATVYVVMTAMMLAGAAAFDLQLAVDSTVTPDPLSSRITNDGTSGNHPGSLFLLKPMAAGSHTVYILGETNAASTASIAFTWLSAFLLGG